jgi:hypothetical protein
MHTVTETEIFQRYASAIWSEAEYAAFISWVAENPLAGDVIPGTTCLPGFSPNSNMR